MICLTINFAKGPERALVSSPAWGTVVDLGPTSWGDGRDGRYGGRDGWGEREKGERD
jgi:hypothetical protein